MRFTKAITGVRDTGVYPSQLTSSTSRNYFQDGPDDLAAYNNINGIYAVDTSVSANTIAVTLDDTYADILAYTTDFNLFVKIANANSGATVINCNVIGNKAIKKNVSDALVTGDLLVGQIAHLHYDGTNFQLLNPADLAIHRADTTLHASAMAAWIPTLEWTTATPTGITTVARKCTVGKLCFVKGYIALTNGQGATNLTIPLPVAAYNSNPVAVMISGAQFVGAGTVTNPVAQVDELTQKIKFSLFSTCTAGQAAYIYFDGCYEIA